ncbi:hypothetical protein M514_10525 [Trichuris suis]|uniref:Uncharacterized protein n=1 Tax=Trichuris suis TaxID=68888 RepID=A0A085LUE5_9BILA|nr:hypothetical protein M513_10525 [Trichuris suis]KFD63979.1 hypothetical protein M514_10525 [Trichuris suis]
MSGSVGLLALSDAEPTIVKRLRSSATPGIPEVHGGGSAPLRTAVINEVLKQNSFKDFVFKNDKKKSVTATGMTQPVSVSLNNSFIPR